MNKPSSLWWLLLVLLAGACSRPAPRLTAELQRTTPWSADFVEHFGSLPLQQEGRVMPYSTLAAFTLYAVHGQRDVRFVSTGPNGKDATTKLNPTEWLLDVWCFPDQAQHYPLFRIENVKVLEALGFEHEGQKQGFEYLSYAQMLPQGQKLGELTEPLRHKPPVTRSEVENQLVHLMEQLVVYHRLHQQVAALSFELAISGDKLRAVFGGAERIGLAKVLANAAKLRELVSALGPDAEKLDEQHGNLGQLISFVNDAAENTGGPLLLPPVRPAAEADTWHSLSEIFERGMRGDIAAEHLRMIEALQAGLIAKTMGEREQHLGQYRDLVDTVAARRGDQATVGLESYYYAANWHFHAMMTFVLGFLIAVGACVLPRVRLLWWASMIVSLAAVGMLTADVWIRCLITGHPPITRLYDTFMFIGGGGALTLLIAECVLARRFCLVLAPFWGALLIMLGRLFEVADGADTMKPLQAVLLSNFWLGIHVPTMNVGYLASAVAAAVGGTWVVTRVLRFEHPDSTFMKALVRVTYGITCFGLATSVIGTILGGVWANDSWGRFWGWDPKENGALLICLSQIALLHARMSGMVRDAGFVLWSIATGMIVVFSWFHTNLLGVGLHAYGFSKDLLTGVWVSYAILGGLIVAGGIDVLLRPKPAPFDAAEPSATPALDA